MGKWDDDIPLRPTGDVQPTTVSALLRSVRMAKAPDSVKERVIKAWLGKHTPSETLINSLQRGGYGHLVQHQRRLRRAAG